MIHYKIIFYPEALLDIQDLFTTLAEIYKVPLTADRYVNGLWDAIEGLENHAGSLSISHNKYLQQKYGLGIRRLNYKKIAILFFVEKNEVYIAKILPSSLIKEL